MITLAGNASSERRAAERQFKEALKDDPDKKNVATRTLEAAYNAAVSKENQQTESSGQARTPFGF